jgi:hypothetical protein
LSPEGTEIAWAIEALSSVSSGLALDGDVSAGCMYRPSNVNVHMLDKA